MSILGNETQILIYSSMLDSMRIAVNKIKNDMGILEAYITVPAIYLKRIIG